MPKMEKDASKIPKNYMLLNSYKMGPYEKKKIIDNPSKKVSSPQLLTHLFSAILEVFHLISNCYLEDHPS